MPPPFVHCDPVYQETQINFKGLHNFELLYKMIFDWLKVQKYEHYPTGTDNVETYFQETLISPGGPKNNWIWWRTRRKESDMFYYHIEINMQTLVLNTKEVVFKGEKIKMNDGEINIFIKGFLEVDPTGQWREKDNNFLSSAYQIYKDRDFWNVIDDKESEVCEHAGLLFERCKQFLNLMTMASLQKPFHPQLGYPQMQ